MVYPGGIRLPFSQFTFTDIPGGIQVVSGRPTRIINDEEVETFLRSDFMFRKLRPDQVFPFVDPLDASNGISTNHRIGFRVKFPFNPVDPPCDEKYGFYGKQRPRR